MLLVHWWTLVIHSFQKGSLPLNEIVHHFGSVSTEMGPKSFPWWYIWDFPIHITASDSHWCRAIICTSLSLMQCNYLYFSVIDAEQLSVLLCHWCRAIICTSLSLMQCNYLYFSVIDAVQLSVLLCHWCRAIICTSLSLMQSNYLYFSVIDAEQLSVLLCHWCRAIICTSLLCNTLQINSGVDHKYAFMSLENNIFFLQRQYYIVYRNKVTFKHARMWCDLHYGIILLLSQFPDNYWWNVIERKAAFLCHWYEEYNTF